MKCIDRRGYKDELLTFWPSKAAGVWLIACVYWGWMRTEWGEKWWGETWQMSTWHRSSSPLFCAYNVLKHVLPHPHSASWHPLDIHLRALQIVNVVYRRGGARDTLSLACFLILSLYFFAHFQGKRLSIVAEPSCVTVRNSRVLRCNGLWKQSRPWV